MRPTVFAGAIGSSGLRKTRSGAEHRSQDRSPPSVSHPAARPLLGGGVDGHPEAAIAESIAAVRARTVPDGVLPEARIVEALL